MTALAPRPLIDWRRATTALAWGLLAVLLLANVSLQPSFLTPSVALSNLGTYLPLMLIAAGQAYVVLGGSIDLSLGAVVSLVNVVVVVISEAVGGAGGLLLGMAAGIAAGVACGAVNGLLIAAFRLQAIVTTFATSIVFGGLALTVLPQAGGMLPPGYFMAYMGRAWGVPVILVLMALLVGGLAWIARTRFHAHLLAVGGNRQGAYQTGLPVGRIRVGSHALGGLLAALASLAVLGNTGAGDPLMGQAFTLGSVSAVALGGIALSGGWGSAAGAILGALILSLVNNLIFFAGVPYAYQSIVQGLIILGALAAGILFSRKPG